MTELEKMDCLLTPRTNHTKQIAEMLGLEIGEKFRIKGHPDMGTFWFIEDNSQGLRDIWDYDIGEELYEEFNDVNDLLEQLLTGFYEVEKLPWKPKKGDTYYYYDYLITRNKILMGHTEWLGTMCDLVYWKTGNCYRTENEALIKGQELYEKLKKEFDEA